MSNVLHRLLRTVPGMIWVVRCICSPGMICRGSLLTGVFLASAVHAQEVTEAQALAWYQAGNYDRAKEAFQAILTARPEDPIALFHLGRMADDRNAEQYYLRLLYYTPEHSYADDAMLGLAQIYYRYGRHTDAVKLCNRLLASFPRTDLNDQARYWLGRTLLADKQPALARLTFLQLLSTHPQTDYTLETRMAIAETYRAEESFIEAAKAYLKMEAELRERDELRIVLFRAGQCLEAAGKTQEASHVFQRLIDRFPNSEEAKSVRR